MRSQTARVAIGLLAGVLFVSSAGFSASPGSLAGSLVGFVSSQAGVPQMGAGVLLYNHYDRLVGRTLTNERGAFGFESLSPGTYTIRVTLASFVPAVRQNILIQPGMRSFLSISLASVLSSIELMYSAPGTAKIMSDDWKWVLRTASSTRPVLRFGPQIDITSPAERTAEVKNVFSDTRGLLRVSTGEQGALAAAGTYADLGTAFALATSVFGTNQLELAGSLGYSSNAGVPLAGFRTSFSRPDAFGGNPVVNVTMRQLFLPARVGMAVLAGGADNAPVLRTLAVSSLDKRQLQDNVTLEYGASLESVAFVQRLNYFSPFGRLTYDAGGLGALQLAYSSGMPPAELLASSEIPEADLSQDLSVLALFPRVSLRGGTARVQRAENFEIAYRKAVGSRSFSVGAYRESVTNAAVMMAAPGGFYSSADLLPDLSSNSSIFNLGAYRRMGYMASVTQKVGDELTFALAGGSAGVLRVDDTTALGANPDQLRNQMRRARRGWLAARVTAVSPWTGTRLATSYQWTDYTSLSPTHLYLTQGFQPDLGWNLQIRQPLPAVSLWSARLEASAELRNLLAQGYVPVSTFDGRKLFLVQNPRAVRGGLSFIF
jgi:hypothetical protein